MERKRKSRIKQLIAICFVVFLAAFSLPFPVRAADMPPMHDWELKDMYTYDTDKMDEGEQELLTWLRLEMRNGSAEHFNTIQHALTAINSNVVASAAGTNENKGVLEKISETVSKLSFAGALQDFFDARTGLGSDEDCTITDTVMNRVSGANSMWEWVGKTLESGGDLTSVKNDINGDPLMSLGIDLDFLSNKMNDTSIDDNPANTIKGFMMALAYFSPHMRG